MAQKFDNISFPGWEVVRKLGEGSFGGVYEIRRTLPDGTIERAALKKLTVPKDQAEITELYAQSYDSESITAHFKERMQDLVREYSFMQKLGENPNVVHCQDLRTVQHDDGIGWDIYIRMELLTPLKLWLKDRYDERQVIRLGLNMCGALHGCHQRNIIHRDIKPENILVNEEGRFKLGDFGIAKVSEKTATGTLTGTYSYMAPEIANRQHYGTSADIYSLGLVMYWMMNERTLPFLPLGKKIPSGVQRQEAQDRRFSGEAIPAPINGSPELTRIVLKACAFDPKERYHTVQELAGDLKRHYQTIRAGKKSPANPIPAENRKPNTNVMEELGVTPEMLTDYPSRNSGSISRRETVSNNRGYYDASFREPSSGMDKHPPSQPMRDPKGRETGPNMKKWIFRSVVVCSILAFLCAGGYLLWTSYTNLQERNRQAAAYAEAYELEETGRIAEAAMAYYRLGERERSLALWDEAAVRDSISAGYDHTVSIKADGTVVAVGNNEDGQCNTSAWKDIAAISTGTFHTLGLKSDGTVVGVGNYMDNRRKVGDWKDIVAISAGGAHTVGLKADGTVIAVGNNKHGQCDISAWTGIAAISAGSVHTVGLKSDGTVVAVGLNDDGRCDISGWDNIVAISAGEFHTVGLKADGTVVATGRNDTGQCNVSSWNNILAVSAGVYHTVGLKSDGTMVAVGNNFFSQCDVSGWKDVVAISAGEFHTIGLKADGTVTAVGNNDNGQRDVSGWSNIKIPPISQERWDKLDAARQERQKTEQYAKAKDLLNQGNYGQAIPALEALDGYQDSAALLEKAQLLAPAAELENSGRIAEAAMAYYRLGEREKSLALWDKVAVRDSIGAGGNHTLALKENGTVVAAGWNDFGQCDVSNWKNVIDVKAGMVHSVGLKRDGTVVAVGENCNGECNVGDWTDIVAISADDHYTLGLRADGTVVATGVNLEGRCDVGEWTDIVAIRAGGVSVGLKEDGTVVTVGMNSEKQQNLNNWTNLIAVCVGRSHLVGLKSDGTVIASMLPDTEWDVHGQCDVSSWKNIVAIRAGVGHTVGLKADGTVVATGWNYDGQCDVSDWTDIVSISAEGFHTVGLKADGTVIAVGENYGGQCDVSDWNNIKLPVR